ncbi:hypothetical protein D3C87_839040 [compost metagenome]
MAKSKMELIREFAAKQGVEIVEIKVKRVRAKDLAGLPKMVEQTNAMTGKKFMEAEGTPYYASPRSETYWCS